MWAQDAAEALGGPDPPATVATLIRSPPTIGADDGPREIRRALAGHGGTGLPVLDREGTALVGWITYETVLARMHPDLDAGPDAGR
ncbi:MAG TPA: CBS domain-containing protein [Mycobacterium sp.]|nr:CBS domain-containing protein [Mycobacterium sp.]